MDKEFDGIVADDEWNERIAQEDRERNSGDVIESAQEGISSNIKNDQNFNNDLFVVKEDLAKHIADLKIEMEKLFKLDYSSIGQGGEVMSITIKNNFISAQDGAHERFLFIDDAGRHASGVKNTIYTTDFLSSGRTQPTSIDKDSEFYQNNAEDIQHFLFVIVPDMIRKIKGRKG